MIKKLTTLSIFAAFCCLLSCRRPSRGADPTPVPSPTKTVRFVLYTNEDFSTDNDTISFALTIRNNTGTTSSRTIFDSTIATRLIKDIPGPAHKLVFEKTVPDNGSIYTAGFIYTTRFGVGWSLDTIGTKVKSKVLEYPFR